MDTPEPRQTRPSLPHTPLAEAMVLEHKPMVTPSGTPIDPPDKGSPISRVLGWTLALVLAGLVIFWQNSPEDLQRSLVRSPAPTVVELTELDPAPGMYSQTDIVSRMFIKMRHFFGQGAGAAQSPFPIMSQVDGMIQGNEDRVRAAIISAEYEGGEQALARLDDLDHRLGESLQEMDMSSESSDAELNSISLLENDIAILRTIYEGQADTLDDSARASIAARYSKLGRVALTFGLDDDHPERKPLITGMGSIVLIELIVIVGLLVVPLLGLITLIVGIVLFSTKKLRFADHKPTPGGSVFIETYALFVGAFLLIAIGGRIISDHEHLKKYAMLVLPIQWLLLTTVFWGLLRGMNLSKWRQAIGMHSGKGVFREIGCGVLGYLAAIPVFLIGVAITVILLIFSGLMGGAPGEETTLPTNPIFEMIAGGDLITVVLLFTMATIWAPLCEELIFRGALYRHMRGYVHWLVAAMGTAVLFAFMHSYGPLFVSPLIALGFMFAVMRHWRGSLIAPMTAHFIHNFTVLSFTILLVWTISG